MIVLQRYTDKRNNKSDWVEITAVLRLNGCTDGALAVWGKFTGTEKHSSGQIFTKIHFTVLDIQCSFVKKYKNKYC